jgi:hypothetical protein
LILSALPTLAADDSRLDPAALAKRIDEQVTAQLTARQVTAAPQADDATFFRRIHLALGGRIPRPEEVKAFLADPSPDKRGKAIDRLLDSPAFASHFARSCAGWLLQGTAADVPGIGAEQFESWLTARTKAGMPLDRLATELLTFSFADQQLSSAAPAADNAAGPLAFYLSHEAKPENLAAVTSRVFLGVRLECAQCHDHPFAKWKRDQFWGLAAFFAGLERTGGVLREVPGRRELPVPNSDRAAPATFLDGREPEWQYKKSPRGTLAAWLTEPGNPFFARAMANRLWWFVFGIGLVEAVDDFHDQNPPSHPELLDNLARGLVQSRFDAKFLLRAICRSEAFGRSSAPADREQSDQRLFAQFPTQALTPGQLFDSLEVVFGAPLEPKSDKMPAPAANPLRRRFLETFATSGPAVSASTSIPQVLALMNGDLVNQVAYQSKVVDASWPRAGQSVHRAVDVLYVTALSRLPHEGEVKRAHRFLKAGVADETRQRYGDLLWALLNSLEFRTNH